MNTFTKSTGAMAVSLLMALPATAQGIVPDRQGPPLDANETAEAYARNNDVCGGAALLSAEFIQGQDFVRARCDSAGLTMGAPGAAAAAGGALAIVLVALASDSSSTTTTP